VIVGIDYHDTISTYPRLFKELAQQILSAGGSVHIVSAVGPSHEKEYTKAIRRCGVPYTSIEIIVYEQHWQAPKLKLHLAESLGIEMMIDDRLDTCQLFASRGILALKVCNFGDKPLS
jgi:hypothetical protein